MSTAAYRLFAAFARSYELAFGLSALATLPAHVLAQPAAPVRGIYNWIHTTGDAEKSFPFYRDVFGIELARSPFAGPAPPNSPPERIRPAAEASSDPLVWDLTDTRGARFRTAFTRAPNTPFGLELPEFFDIPRSTRAANPWDPGASMLLFDVRRFDAVLAKLKALRAPIVTLGGNPVDTAAGRAIVVRDPDGYLVQVTEASAAAMARATADAEIVGTSIGIAVADTAASLDFYRGLLGFVVRETRHAASAELRLNGLAEGELVRTTTLIPGTEVRVLFSEFRLPSAPAVPAAPFRWRIQDVGAPQFQLEVTGLDSLIERTKTAGYRFLSVGAKPIRRPFGRFVFAIDPDGVLVELVEPAERP